MPKPRKDQKEIAQQYAGNLRYFNRLHPFRRLRMFLMFFFTLAAMAIGAIYLLNWPSKPASSSTSASTPAPPAGSTAARPLEWLNSPGAISQAHSRFAQDCEKCHDPAVKANPALAGAIKQSLDAKCETCHNTPPYTFHQANVVGATACVDCHQEHLGSGTMQPVADRSCVACHGNADTMAQSVRIGQGLAAVMQPFHFDPHLVYFTPEPGKPLRPASGYTQVFQSFADGHPDFQIQRENLRDPDTLKFNHKFHFSDQVRTADGKPLACEMCHKLDSRGAYLQPITFAADCQSCHAIKIDPALPDFIVPHPTSADASSVRSFLLTLPVQYAAYAQQVKGLTQSDQITAFVSGRMKAVQQRVRSGENLEREVFFSDGKTVRYGDANSAMPAERALFPGCAECHDVSSVAGVPKVTPPVIPDRWYVHAKFDHAAHAAIRTCEECHSMARQSERTSDVLLPDKASCVSCHSPKGGVASNCTTCHDFHNEAPAHETASLTPMRKMMLGGAAVAGLATHP